MIEESRKKVEILKPLSTGSTQPGKVLEAQL